MVVLNRDEDKDLPEVIKYLPQNYNFEIKKTLSTIRKLNAKKITLQFPDGLLKYSMVIIDAIKFYTGAESVILNDVVYGACCVDDESINSDLLIHYGHSCLIPITDMKIRTLYIFVDIKIDVTHICDVILKNFTGRVAIIGTIQFNSSISKIKRILNKKEKEKNLDSVKPKYITPQIYPLSPGEVLGCTSPKIKDVEAVISIGDGRFHLESMMINNPELNFFKYCPFTRKMTKEHYDYDIMIQIRKREIEKAFKGKTFGIILGALGRQGNRQILKNIKNKLKAYKQYIILLEEINEKSLERYSFIDSFVQISCPRLSVDWGSTYKKPLLSPFEVFYEGGSYNMDYYSKEGNAPWKNYNNDYNE